MNQLTLFDNPPPTAAQLRDRAIDRAASGASQEWLQEAQRAVGRVARARQEFTTDDVWQIVGSPAEPRAMGAVMRWAKKEGLCKATDRTRLSERRECHCRPLTVWWSLVYGG